MRTSLKDYLALFFTIAISLILIYSNDNLQLRTMRIWVLEINGWLLQQTAQYYKLRSVYKENRALQIANTTYAVELLRVQEALLENTRLRSLLDFTARQPFKFVAAAVIGSGLNRNVNTIILDRGSRAGLAENMPVVTPDGLVGKLIYVSENFAYAHILYDRNFRVSVKIQRTRINGILSWDSGPFCQVNQIPRRMDVKPGDILITSGFSSTFPEGIKVGMVVSTSNESKGLFKKVLAQPSVNLSNLEEVLIITNFPKQAE